MDGTGPPKSGVTVRIRPGMPWATSVPGARLSYKQQDRVQLLGCLPICRVASGRHPVLQTGVGEFDPPTRRQIAPAAGRGLGASNADERFRLLPGAPWSASRRQADLLNRPCLGKHQGGSPYWPRRWTHRTLRRFALPVRIGAWSPNARLMQLVDMPDSKPGFFSVQIRGRAPNGPVTQWSECHPLKLEVEGSTPSRSSIALLVQRLEQPPRKW